MKKHLLLLVLGIYCINQINNVFAQRRDSIYYSNFIYHADGSQCKHTPPQTSFMFFINNNDNKILIENAPRWGIGDPNIKGNGIYGVELANFINPVVTIGDTVCARFICSAAQQQVISKEVINGFPWIRMPQFLTMSAVNIPSAPMNVKLFSDTLDMTCRTLTWTSNTGEKYRIYRRTDDDVTPFNEPRMLYSCIASDIIGGTFVDSTCQINKRYAYIIFAIVENNIVSHHSMEVIDPSPFEPGEDITIGYIARLPRINYIWGSSDPSYDGWPAEGSTVTWQATVKNWFGKTLKSVQYKWILDTTIVDTGSVDIPANSTTEINYQWKWVFDRHKLTLIIDPLNLIQEEEELNNNLTIFTNAISAGFYVEQRTYDYFHMYQKMLKVHSNCWEDWAQRHTSRWNQMFTNAIYPESPQGVLDRIRIDKITVVPDGALPLAGGSYPTNMPNLNDRTVDLQWGFTAEGVQGSFYSNHTSVSDNNPFYFEGSLLHELGHARYLIDVYGFNVHDDGTGNVIAVTENGRNVVQSSLVPRNYYTPMNGLMNGQYTYIDRYSAAAMNLIAGCRAVIGNYNAPGNI